MPLTSMRRLRMRWFHMCRLNMLSLWGVLPLAFLTLLPHMIIPLRRAASATIRHALLLASAIVRRMFLTRRR